MEIEGKTFEVASWQDVTGENLASWKARWPDFSPRELACKGTGRLVVHGPSLDLLQALRTKLGRPILINSAYRSPSHNRAVGGAANSQHLLARAYDCSMANFDPGEFMAEAKAIGFTGFGTYPKENFVHIDTGPARSWGKPFTLTPTRLPKPQEVKEWVDVAKSVGVVAGGSAATVASERGVDPLLIFAALAAAGCAYLLWKLYQRGGEV